MLRLLSVHESFGSLGGAEANVLITATELKKRGVIVGLWSRRATGKGEERWREVFGDNVYWETKDTLASVRERFAPDVAYVHKWDHLPTLENLVESGLPLARMVHEHDIYCLRSYRYNPLTRAVCHRPISGYCVFPCLAPLKRNREGGLPFEWVSYFDKLKELALVRRSDRIKLFPPVPRPGEPLEPSFSNRNLILYVGQIIRGKGVDLLLKTLARGKTPFDAVILGDGNAKAACEKLSRKLGLENRVRFAGFIPQDELKACYRDASLVAVSFVWPEPIATIGLEVMRYGLPVVASNAGHIPGWLHDNETGRLVPWGDVPAYAAAMHRPALATPLSERLVAALLWLPAQLLALAADPRTTLDASLPGGTRLALSTGSRGCLLARRAGRLGAVVAGRLRLIGILPRNQPPAHLPAETRALLAHTPPSVFSLADLHEAHTPRPARRTRPRPSPGRPARGRPHRSRLPR
jgi:glycosyltransferase involved in cell wall biosynthesis